ncbi:ABC transporter substrate-binding protein [Microbacterium sp. CPCC 204701]|uniref:ABC transporter substrate-binding protein n=1 Tax=Microbacterium sp. CPCC 204701 TaxID=2493084 RepID=UPI000FDB2711|nr:ABC transporter substrate-binding protein [Microbacterium sp. CPCC 204701]
MQSTIRRAIAVASIVVCSSLAGCAAGGSALSAGEESDCSQPPTTGVDDDTIKIGATVPLSGALSVYGGAIAAQRAYFDMVNAEGGVTSKDGKTRQIELVVLDDAYDPSKAKTNTDELVNREEVFALSHAFGTSQQLAARPVLEEACAPSVWIASGNPAISDPEHPYLVGIGVLTVVEGQVMAQYLRENMPDATVAILAQNGDFGVPFVEGFTETIEGSGVTIVDTQTYEPTDTDVRAQVTTLAASGADAFFIVGTGNAVLQAMNNAHSLGWTPQILVPQGAAVSLDVLRKLDPGAADGALIGNVFKDPERDADDPAMRLFLEEFAKQPNASGYSEAHALGGWIAGELTVKVLESLESVDRESFIDAVHDFRYDAITVVKDGIPLYTSPGEPYIVRGEGLDVYDAGAGTLSPFQVVDASGR